MPLAQQALGLLGMIEVTFASTSSPMRDRVWTSRNPRATRLLIVVLATLTFLSTAACVPVNIDSIELVNIITVTGPSTLRVEETAQLSIATIYDGNSSPLEPSGWRTRIMQSSDPRVLTVTGTGEVRGISPGTVTILVTRRGRIGGTAGEHRDYRCSLMTAVRKGDKVARCILVSHPLGWELRLDK